MGLSQGSATPGWRAKSGTPEGFAWHAKRFHAQVNFKLLRFNKFTFEVMSAFSAVGSNVTQLRHFLANRTFTYVKTSLTFSEESGYMGTSTEV